MSIESPQHLLEKKAELEKLVRRYGYLINDMERVFALYNEMYEMHQDDLAKVNKQLEIEETGIVIELNDGEKPDKFVIAKR